MFGYFCDTRYTHRGLWVWSMYGVCPGIILHMHGGSTKLQKTWPKGFSVLGVRSWIVSRFLCVFCSLHPLVLPSFVPFFLLRVHMHWKHHIVRTHVFLSKVLLLLRIVLLWYHTHRLLSHFELRTPIPKSRHAGCKYGSWSMYIYLFFRRRGQHGYPDQGLFQYIK